MGSWVSVCVSSTRLAPAWSRMLTSSLGLVGENRDGRLEFSDGGSKDGGRCCSRWPVEPDLDLARLQAFEEQIDLSNGGVVAYRFVIWLGERGALVIA